MSACWRLPKILKKQYLIKVQFWLIVIYPLNFYFITTECFKLMNKNSLMATKFLRSLVGEHIQIKKMTPNQIIGQFKVPLENSGVREVLLESDKINRIFIQEKQPPHSRFKNNKIKYIIMMLKTLLRILVPSFFITYSVIYMMNLRLSYYEVVDGYYQIN